MKEEWRRVRGFGGLYEVSSLGRVRSYAHDERGRLLNPWRNPKGYLVVELKKSGGGATKQVHRLVAEAFIGPCPKGKQVNHKIPDKEDNRASNLEYVTPKENIHHAILHGLRAPPMLGQDNATSKLTESKVRRIRLRVSRGETQTAVAKDYGVTQANVSEIVRRRTWRHVK